ncbi:MAG TPA: hypothetical protein PK252_02805 [Bacteroidales bacterium]|nr:hypothetical protein [Bacteroidales bacterium]
MNAVLRIIFFVSLVIVGFSACTVREVISVSHSARDNVTIDGIALGTASYSKLFGVETSSADACVLQARLAMYRAFPLQPNQAFDNMVVEKKTTYFPFYSKTRFLISADIITPEIDSKNRFAYSPSFENMLFSNKKIEHEGLQLADSVVFKYKGKYTKGVILDFSDKSVWLGLNFKNQLRIVKASVNKVFAIGNEELEDELGLETGQIIEISYVSTNNNQDVCSKEIVGMNKYHVLILQKNGTDYSYQVVAANKIKEKKH